MGKTSKKKETTEKQAKGAKKTPKAPPAEEDPLLRSLQLLDSIVQFLTRATGQSLVPIVTVRKTIPSNNSNSSSGSSIVPWGHLQKFLHHGVIQTGPPPKDSTATIVLQELQTFWTTGSSSSSSDLQIGFPMPDERRLSGSTKAAAKRRMAYLKKQIKQEAKKNDKKYASDKIMKSVEEDEEDDEFVDESNRGTHFSDMNRNDSSSKDWALPSDDDDLYHEEPVLEMERLAKEALGDLLGLTWSRKASEARNGQALIESNVPTSVIPKQASYAGSNAAQEADYVSEKFLEAWKNQLLDPRLHNVLPKRLYRHQSISIKSALSDIPTLVCTGTGSGKSLCFLLPVLQAALQGHLSMLLFPTKALAQDQVVKLQAWLQKHGLDQEIRAATLDGDTPHSQRVLLCTTCNVILTNPDTLHAAILPNWKQLYAPLLKSLRYVVMDEAHMYQGVFGAHVAMILARLYRVACCSKSKIVFLACSATLPHPEHHFRLLCCIPSSQEVNVITKDSSPRAAKHFWVWNPPLMDGSGKSIGRVQILRRKKKEGALLKSPDDKPVPVVAGLVQEGPTELSTSDAKERAYVPPAKLKSSKIWYRRHSADETALLLARAVSQGVRCIAFCKTRCLVEWVYERTLAALKKSPHTAKLMSRVESYRGGYTKSERRQIEKRLFQNELLGVVGTSALELGVDIGGVDLTLHCGFPSSHASLLQQAGRAGRGASACHRPSLAICVCFNSPLDQHLWRYPTSLLKRGFSAPLSMPIYPGLVQGHLLCAGQEFPLAGSMNPALIQATESDVFERGLLSDEDVFGSKSVYQEAMETLLAQGSFSDECVPIVGAEDILKATIYKTHPSIKNPWTNVSIRSIEPVSYNIVDMSHPMQGGKMDGIHNPAAVMDTIPYSRIFYHAFPGAIITHRSRRYKIVSMVRPPAFGKGFRGSVTLGAFAKPCSDRYFTRPLSSLKINVIKQLERVDLVLNSNACSRKAVATSNRENSADSSAASLPHADASEIYIDEDPSAGSFAGCGVVNVKRNVHGYKKLSMVTREELSRSELCLPDMEFDSFGFWLDCDAAKLSKILTETELGHGIHALSHAILAVAPLFVPCVKNDVQCDHSVHHPTRVTIFDERAGGSGICAQLWKFVFVPKGLIETAIGLLETCPSCSMDSGYAGGCPACIQAGECIKFNDYLCKSSALLIAKHLLKRLQKTDLYKKNSINLVEENNFREDIDGAGDVSSTPTKKRSNEPCSERESDIRSTPRKRARAKAMRNAKDISSAKKRLVVVGRPSWPMERSEATSRQENHE